MGRMGKRLGDLCSPYSTVYQYRYMFVYSWKKHLRENYVPSWGYYFRSQKGLLGIVWCSCDNRFSDEVHGSLIGKKKKKKKLAQLHMLKFNQCEELDARFGNECFNKRSMKFTVLWHKYLPSRGESCHTDPQMSSTILQL